MASLDPRVFTIPSGAPFLPTLADALTHGRILERLRDAAELSRATIYLPTRRAARALATLLAAHGDGRAQLLPRIVPLGEADGAEFELAGPDGAAFEGAEALAPPIAPLERRLVLTRLIQRWAETVDRARLRLEADAPLLVPSSPADAVGLAGDLERLMDAFTTEGIAWEQLAEAVEVDFSEYFGLTLDFVRIATENWPKMLAEREASDPASRRSALIHAEARRLLRERPTAPVIAAGSTGSMPATAALLNAIAHLPNGAVVLPGLDTDLDEASWASIGGLETDDSDPVHGHPQAMLRRLLDGYFRIPRAAVQVLDTPAAPLAARSRVLSEALRPADTTDLWGTLPAEARADLARQGCDGIKLVEAADERDEALAAAIALRETLAAPDRTAVLVTPDRGLAKRTAAELARWGIAVEDSAGVPLSETPAGILARLAADAAALDFHPTRLLALLAHREVRLGWPRAVLEQAASALEIGVLRGPAPAPGLGGLRHALAGSRTAFGRHTPRPRRRLSAEDWKLAADLVARLEEAFAGFTAETLGEEAVDLVALVHAHRRTVEALGASADEPDADGADDGSAEALAALFDDLVLSETGGVRGRFADYPAFFTTLARERVTSAVCRRSTHRRVRILGLLEARLLSADRVVLGGLDEGVWPPRTETDAFLNRPMRARVGLSPPERRIGQTAHDFVQALGTRDVVITRAQKRDGAPTVPSRFLQRMKAFTGEAIWRDVAAAGERYLRLARALETPKPARPLPRPAPKPDPALFPRTLSVTEIETLVRDPYSIFARHVLKLDALEPIAGTPSAAERGTIIHDVLGSFASDHARELPPHALEDLMQRGEDAFGRIADAFPELYAEWWPRFVRLASEFVVWEEARRPALACIHPELSGALPIALPDGSTFTLRARADRIEARRDGSYAIIDFKTGTPPGVKEVFAGFSPQLTLEAVMLMQGAFRNVPAAPGAPDLVYVHTSGGRNPLKPRELKPPPGDTRSLADIIEQHRVRFTHLLGRYVSGEIGYLSRPYPKYAKRYSDYDHLARVKEWSLTNGADENGLE
jgi:ATP-dependent helicase/nuclease subunit B